MADSDARGAAAAEVQQPLRFELPKEGALDVPETPAASSTEEVTAEPQKTVEPAPTTPKDESKSEQPTPEPDAAKRREQRFQNRLNAAYRKVGEANALVEQERRQAQELRSQLEGLKQPIDPNEPKLDQYDDLDKYHAALKAYTKEATLKETQTRTQREARTQAQRTFSDRIAQNWEAKSVEGEDKYPDFTEVVGDLKPDTWFGSAIMDSEIAAELAYHLGKNEEEAIRIAKMPAWSGVRELGKIEARLTAQPDKPKTPSKAPEPIKPVSGVEAGSSDEPSESDDMATWIKKRQRQVHGPRGNRR